MGCLQYTFIKEDTKYIFKLSILKVFEQHSQRKAFPSCDLTLYEVIPEQRIFGFNKAL